MNFKTKATAAIVAAVALVAGLIIHDQVAVATQDRTTLAQKREVAARATSCTLYGSGCLGDWAGYQHGVDGDAATADVLVVGDSIVNRCRIYLRLRLVPYGLTTVFDYWSSRPSADAPSVSAAAGAVTRTLSYSRIYQPGGFKAVAMLTGTNDILLDPPGMAAQTQRMKVADSPVIWGTVYAGRSATLTADVRNAGWVNQQIAASGFPISDWSGFLAGYPGYRIPAHVPDGIHPDYGTGVIGDGSGCDSWAAIHAPRIAAVAG